MGCLYMVTTPGGLSYIGITRRTAEARFREHRYASLRTRKNALSEALRRHHAVGFTIRTLAIADDWDFLCELERRAIRAYGTQTPRGLNVSGGGRGVYALPTSIRAKIIDGVRKMWAMKSRAARWEFTAKQVAAMRKATADQQVEDARRAAISATMKERGIGRGSRNAAAKLNEAAVVDIRRRVSVGESLEQIAATFGVSRSAIVLIARRERWQHVI